MARPPRYDPHIELFPAPELGNTTFMLADPDAGAAAVVDPMRDVGQYLDRAERLGVRITHAFDTHVHNDFVSGARELQAEVGARICAGRGSDLQFEHDALSDGSEVHVGRWRVRALKTPGHTPAHVGYVVLGPSSPPRALFSGGALMVGGMARTDLFGPHLAAHLAFEAFRTLQVRLRRLPDDVAVYPTHGGGSFCGVAGSDEPVTTMGRERQTNPYLLTTDLMAFIARALHQGPYPIYYKDMMALNQLGAPLLGRSPAPPTPLSAPAVEDLQRRGAADRAGRRRGARGWPGLSGGAATAAADRVRHRGGDARRGRGRVGGERPVADRVRDRRDLRAGVLDPLQRAGHRGRRAQRGRVGARPRPGRDPHPGAGDPAPGGGDLAGRPGRGPLRVRSSGQHRREPPGAGRAATGHPGGRPLRRLGTAPHPGDD